MCRYKAKYPPFECLMQSAFVINMTWYKKGIFIAKVNEYSLLKIFNFGDFPELCAKYSCY